MIIKTFIQGPIDANNYLLIDEESKDAVLIDCSSPNDEFINLVKSEDVRLKYILLTHGHFDHILGCDKFNEVFNVPIYVNENDLIQIKLAPEMMFYYAGGKISGIKNINNLIKDAHEINFGKYTIKAISTPGHTKGGMCYLVDGKLFSGDTLFKGSVGRCDLQDGDLNELLKSVKEKIFTLPDEITVYPGHGPKTTIGYEKKYNEISNI